MSDLAKSNGDPGVCRATPQSRIVPLWVRLIVIVGAVLIAAGGVLALVNPSMMVSARDEINGAVRIYASYLASRNLALAIMLCTLLAFRASRALSHLMVLVALTQLLDASMDCAEGRWILVPGVLGFGVIFLLAANRISAQPIWEKRAWSD